MNKKCKCNKTIPPKIKTTGCFLPSKKSHYTYCPPDHSHLAGAGGDGRTQCNSFSTALLCIPNEILPLFPFTFSHSKSQIKNQVCVDGTWNKFSWCENIMKWNSFVGKHSYLYRLCRSSRSLAPGGWIGCCGSWPRGRRWARKARAPHIVGPERKRMWRDHLIHPICHP